MESDDEDPFNNLNANNEIQVFSNTTTQNIPLGNW